MEITLRSFNLKNKFKIQNLITINNNSIGTCNYNY